ncbi:MAG: hypothetical protein WC789_10595 [Lentisphaeria bacterium]
MPDKRPDVKAIRERAAAVEPPPRIGTMIVEADLVFVEKAPDVVALCDEVDRLRDLLAGPPALTRNELVKAVLARTDLSNPANDPRIETQEWNDILGIYEDARALCRHIERIEALLRENRDVIGTFGLPDMAVRIDAALEGK